MIVAGNGVRVGQACAALAELARALDVPVVTTASGKGVFDETDPLAAGVMGSFGWPSANEVLGGADVVLAVGTKLGPHDTADEHVDLLDPGRQTLIQIDIEPLNAAWTFPADHVLVADANVVARPPARPRWRRRPPGAAPARPGWPRRSTATTSSAAPEFSADEMPLAPQRIISVLHETFPDDATVACDAGENRLFMMHWYRSKTPAALPPAGRRRRHGLRRAGGAWRPSWPPRPPGAGGVRRRRVRHVDPRADDRGPGAPADRRARVQQRRARLGAARDGREGRGRRVRPGRPRRRRPLDRLRRRARRERQRPARRHQGVADADRPFVIDVPTSLATSFRDVTQDIRPQRLETGY